MIEISEEVRRAWAMVQGAPPDWLIDTLADFARDQLAARLEAEWATERLWFAEQQPQDKWTFADWQREAERLLSGKEKS